MKRHAPWTSGQLSRLRQHYPTMPLELLAQEFAPHTITSIKTTAKKLGIKRRGQKYLIAAAAHKPTYLFGGQRV